MNLHIKGSTHPVDCDSIDIEINGVFWTMQLNGSGDLTIEKYSTKNVLDNPICITANKPNNITLK